MTRRRIITQNVPKEKPKFSPLPRPVTAPAGARENRGFLAPAPLLCYTGPVSAGKGGIGMEDYSRRMDEKFKDAE